MSKFLAALRLTKIEETNPSPTVDVTAIEENKHNPATDGDTATNGNDAHSQCPDDDLQHGVHDAEAVTLTWSKRSLIAVFCKYAIVCDWEDPYLTIILVQHMAFILRVCIPELYPEQPDSQSHQ